MKRNAHLGHSLPRGVIAALLALILATALALPAFADGWYCPDCGRYNDSNYCPKDGTKKPTDLDENVSESWGGGQSGGRQPVQRQLCVGDSICLGTYEQDNLGGQQEAIEWIVLETKGNNALLLSRYGLEAGQPFLNRYAACTWETSSVREWLNGDFLNNVFTSAESGCILETWVDNGKAQGNPKWSTQGGESTLDRLFLLSYAEAVTYFGTNEARRCAPTDYALSQGAWTYDKYSPEGRLSGVWWLRSPGETRNYAACVDLQGSALYQNSVGNNYVCVRPAMWVDMTKLP